VNVPRDGATVQVSGEKLNECRRLLDKIRRQWPQYGIDGHRNIWIVKPGDKSKGIGQFVTRKQ
jgi:tubulin monoglycylase TTLL3/8